MEANPSCCLDNFDAPHLVNLQMQLLKSQTWSFASLGGVVGCILSIAGITRSDPKATVNQPHTQHKSAPSQSKPKVNRKPTQRQPRYQPLPSQTEPRANLPRHMKISQVGVPNPKNTQVPQQGHRKGNRAQTQAAAGSRPDFLPCLTRGSRALRHITSIGPDLGSLHLPDRALVLGIGEPADLVIVAQEYQTA